jgi:hypothetical protein
MKKLLLSAVFLAATFISANAQDPCTQSSPGTIANGGFFGGTNNQSLAVDIPIYEGTSFAINTIKINTVGAATYFNILIREDNAGVPGNVIDTYNNVTITGATVVGNNFGFDFYENTIDVSSNNISFSSTSGDIRYWMEVQSDADGWESDSIVSVGLPGAFANNATSGAWTIGTGDYIYELIGECTGDIPLVYCDGGAADCTYETITNVTFGGINNSTGCDESDFTSMVANVTIGETEQLSVSVVMQDANEYLYVFIDWNQNGILNDAGEVYELLNNGTEVDQTFTIDIVVPNNAVNGETRMRVFAAYDTSNISPCASISYGEVEDYTVNVGGTASTEDFASNFSIYPNPATSVINVANSADVINNVTITDLNGRTVKQVTVGVNDAQINISDLAQGVYILNATSNGKSFTQKIVKQ